MWQKPQLQIPCITEWVLCLMQLRRCNFLRQIGRALSISMSETQALTMLQLMFAYSFFLMILRDVAPRFGQGRSSVVQRPAGSDSDLHLLKSQMKVCRSMIAQLRLQMWSRI